MFTGEDEYFVSSVFNYWIWLLC